MWPCVYLRVEQGEQGSESSLLPRIQSDQSPNICVGQQRLPEFLDVFQIADEDFVVHCRPQNARSEEVNTVQVGYVDASTHEGEEAFLVVFGLLGSAVKSVRRY